MRRGNAALIGAIALLGIGTGAGGAQADGLPAGGIDVGSSGVAAPGSPFRYVTLRSGDGTLLARTAQQGGQVMFSRRIDGRFTIPAVAYDRSAGGLSTDGETLVLIRPRIRFPQRKTVLAIVDTPRLRAHVLTLPGDFSFDAISPNGRWAYLIHYRDPRNPIDYEVRALDTRHLRLTPEPIVDPSEPEEQMGGIPISRAASPDGRWAYTLYDAKEPFIHALDTTTQTAVCVDLPQLSGRWLSPMRLITEAGGGRLAVTDKTGPRLLIDTATFRVSDPAARPSAGQDDGNPLVWLLALGVLFTAIVGLGLRHALPRRPGRTTPGVAAGSTD